MDNVKILSLQFTPIKADKTANLDKVKTLISNTKEKTFDLIVLPEFFDTGFNLSNKEFIKYAECEDSSVVLKELAQIAKQYNSYIHCGSIIFKDEYKCFNRAYLLDRNGEIVSKYDKIHLFDYFGGNEGGYTTAGEKYVVAETDFGKIGFATCFDLRFADMFSTLCKLGAELFVVPAAWSVINKAPETYKTQYLKNWQMITCARAYDNVAYIVTSNEVGDVRPMFTGLGNSMIVDFEGNVLANAKDEETAISARLDFSALRKARQIFPIDNLIK